MTATHVVDLDTDVAAQADEIFTQERVQAMVAVRISGGALGYGNLHLGLLQAVVDTANARGFSLSTVTPAGEHVVLLFDPYEAPSAE